MSSLSGATNFNEQILIKYGEIVLKGLNKNRFEDMLASNVRRRIKDLGTFKMSRAQSTLYIQPTSAVDMDEVSRRIGQVFGIAAYARAAVLPKDFGAIVEAAPEYLGETLDRCRTFKVEAKRSDKRFPMNSPKICAELGQILLERFGHLTVDVHNPDVVVTVEIREEYAFLHSKKIIGAGGIPVGSSGKALLMLSGGIDSPVAGWMMAKRGIELSAVHFTSPPYTSQRALRKVEDLCRKLTPWCGRIHFHSIEFTEIQEKIRDTCPEELNTIILRRMMIWAAQEVAKRFGYKALVTGESVGQVASQTMGAIVCTDAAASIPVFRPVIGMDKSEITVIARKIDTFETSIQPYEDCCTIFTPKHPKTNPSIEEVLEAENDLMQEFTELIQRSVDNSQVKSFELEYTAW